MITVRFNQQSLLLEDHALLSDALHLYQSDNVTFAVAINREYIPRKNYLTTLLKNGDIIETITAMQGG